MNYSSRKFYDSRIRLNSRNRCPLYRSSSPISPSFSRHRTENFRWRYRYWNRVDHSMRTPSRTRHTDFYKQRINSTLPSYLSFKTRSPSFSRSNSRNRHHFRNFMSSYRFQSRPRSGPASASRNFWTRFL